MTQTALIPRSVLFGNPDHSAARVSPNGQWLGWIAPHEGVLNVWIAPREHPDQARPVTFDQDRGVRTYAFCHDDRHILYLQDTGGDENWRVYLLDITSDPLASAHLVTPGDGFQAVIMGHNKWNPTTVVIGVNDRDQQLHDVYSLDLATREFTRIAENPGFAEWLIDSNLAIRGGSTMHPDGSITVYLGQDGTYDPYLTIPPADATTTGPVGFTRSGALLMLSSMSSNAVRLERHDISSGSNDIIAADDAYDIQGIWQDHETLEVQAVEILRERQDIVVLDDSLQPHLAAIRQLGDGDISLHRGSRDNRWWTVTIAPSDGPIHYWLYDTKSQQATYLFPHRGELVGQPLAPMEPFSFTARDGLAVHGYVTFPVDQPRENLPAVLNVHGGPWHRDTWGYDSEAQWLANRGYVCIQVNFRGSTGYGKDFLNAGDKQWGRAMQHDLSDAAAFAVDQGWVDPKRIGIYGGSYGGYAVLAAATFTPELFQCGIDIVGPSSLPTLLASVPEYWKPVIAMMYQRVGNPETEAELLQDASPVHHVDAIRMPLLIVQGANDPRVKQAESEQIVKALKEKNLPHEYLLFDDEGHGLAKPENRETMYAAAESFLAHHLGGRTQD